MLDDRRRTRFDATMTAMDELQPDDLIVEVHCRMENDARCSVEATVRDGRRGLLLAYFPDEVAFLAHELIGLTLEEARIVCSTANAIEPTSTRPDTCEESRTTSSDDRALLEERSGIHRGERHGWFACGR